MDLEFTADQIDLRDNARSVLAGACPPSLVRAVFEGTDDGGADKLWQTLVDLGWPAISIPEQDGGLGLSFVETVLVVEELARVVAPSPFLATVTQFAAFARECGGGGDWLAKVADGSLTGTVAIDGEVTARPVDGGWVLNGSKSFVMDGASADAIAVLASTEEGKTGVFVVEANAVHTTPLTVIDPTMPLADVSFDNVEVADGQILVAPGDPTIANAVRRTAEESVTAMAVSVVGTCRVIFEKTLEYSKVREQFGKPIGSFQALKHRFAKMYLELEKASSLAYFAALTIAEDDDRRTIASSMAKAAASECQRLLVTDGLQLHGGIGFTWENDLHFWLKRAKSADVMFGSGALHRARVAQLLGVGS